MKVLIIDDEKSIRTILSEMVQHWGYEVVLAADGESAWKIFQVINEPIIVLLDWVMPGIDGVELCRRLKQSEKTAHTYVIILTAKRSDVEDVVIGFDAGSDDFLTKPIDPRELSCRLSVGRRILTYQHDLEQRNATLQETTRVMENVMRELQIVNGKLKELSLEDELTGIPNRRSLENYLAKEWWHALREKEALTFIMVDVDFFKYYNDTYGHPAGDECLKKVATILAENVKRSSDITTRYGGEEFAIVLHATDSAGGQKVAEKLRLVVESLAIPNKASKVSPYVTISLGIATIIPDINSSYETLKKEADDALYQAKREGRNRWVAIDVGRGASSVKG